MPELGYGEYWQPKSLEDARRMILTGSTPEQFERAGRFDAELISRYLPPNPVILDFGCGVGRVVKYLPPCRRIFSVDASSEMLSLAKERLKDRNDVLFVQSNGMRFPPQLPHIDLCYSYWTFQHMDKTDAKYVMRRISRALRLGGIVIYTFVQTGGKSNGKGAQIRSWTPEETAATLESMGIKVLEADSARIKRPWPFSSRYFMIIGRKTSLVRPWMPFFRGWLN